jgi:hypothetical protein
MWIEKLAEGVLELDTPIGPRYVELNFAQRAYLLWTFRNFFSLPQQVLRPWEVRLLDRLLAENSFVSIMIGERQRSVIGRIERRAAAPVAVGEVLPFRKPPLREASIADASLRQSASSAEPGPEAASA